MKTYRVCALASHASTAAVRSSSATAARSCRMTASFPALATSTTSTTSTTWPAKAAFSLSRSYVTQHQSTSSSSSSSSKSSSSSSSAAARRRAVTPFNDDGGVPWTQLSAGEKTARAAQQTFNFGMVVVGVVLTGAVGYFLYTEVFSPSSKVSNFNRAVDRIKADHRCTDVLGDGRKITAFGEETSNKWRRARPIASTSRTDAQGTDHLVMNFHVQGPRAQGTAYLHLARRAGQGEFVYRYFYLDVPGHERIYLENADASDAAGDKKRTLFGIKWT